MNTKMIYFGVFVLIGMGLASCAQENNTDISQFEKDEVVFSAQVKGVNTANTRHVAQTWEVGDQVAIMKGDVVKNYKSIDTAGRLEVADGSEPYVWNGTGYELKAWSPVVAGIKNLKDQSSDALFWACDLMTSTANVTSKDVALQFDHAMTRVWFQLQEFKGYTAEEAQAATVTFRGLGEATFNKGELAGIGAADAVIKPNIWINNSNNKKEGEALMIPGDVWEKPLIEVTIAGHTFRYTPKRATEAARETGVLKPGHVQRYYLNIDKSKHDVEVVFVGNINIFNEEGSDKGGVYPDAV